MIRNSKPPFIVPNDVGELCRYRLEKTRLLSLYEENRRDFFDVTAVLYSVAIGDRRSGKLTDQKKGFNSFCDLLTEYFLAAPTQTTRPSIAPNGNHVNFFGKAILENLDNQKLCIQDLYGSGNDPRHTRVWAMVDDFVRHVAIQAFRGGAALLEQNEIEAARKRIDGLRSGSRVLAVPPPPGIFT